MPVRVMVYHLSHSFNLSILECKYVKSFHTSSDFPVLIYPYWNVNGTAAAASIVSHSVLIYPYWNVNLGLSAAVAGEMGFNLSILECKYGAGGR